MGPWLVLGINLVVITIVAAMLRGFVVRRTTQDAALDEIKQEVGSIVTEINQTTERNIQLIEDRIVRLNALIDSADRRVGVLKRHEESVRQTDLSYSRLRNSVRPGAASVDPGIQGNGSSVSGSVSQESGSQELATPVEGATGSMSGSTSGPGPSSDGTTRIVVVPAGDREDEKRIPVRERVRELYLRGLPLERIASLTGHTAGEIELMISLDEG